MSINTGQTISFDSNFPQPSINQSSQQFRDNFAILENVIDALHDAQTPDNTNVLKLLTNVSTLDGAVTFSLSYWNNGLVLPLGQASSNATAGMVCYNSSAPGPRLQFYNGTSWLDVVAKSSTGLVTLDTLTVNNKLTLGFTPTVSTDAVPLGYLNTQLASISNSISSGNTSQANAIAAVQADLNAEKVNRQAADTDLQNQIDTLNSTVSSNAGNATATQTQVDALAQSLAAEANTRLDADNLQSSEINSLNAALSNNTVLLNQIITTANDEQDMRIANDAALQSQIDALGSSGGNQSNALAIETAARIQGDNNNANSIANVASTISGINANVSTLTSRVTVLEGTAIKSFYTSSDPAADPNAVVSTGSLWFMDDGSEQVKRWDQLDATWTLINPHDMLTTGAEMTGTLTMNEADIIMIDNTNATAISLTANTGTIVAKGDIQGLSDESLKFNIETIQDALAIVMSLRGVIYNRNDLPGEPEQMGMIAQEVLPYVPQVVGKLPNGLLTLAYANLVPLLIEAIKALKAEVDSLKG